MNMGEWGEIPLYLKELEFRYNHRDRDLFDDIVQVFVKYSCVDYTEQSPYSLPY